MPGTVLGPGETGKQNSSNPNCQEVYILVEERDNEQIRHPRNEIISNSGRR